VGRILDWYKKSTGKTTLPARTRRAVGGAIYTYTKSSDTKPKWMAPASGNLAEIQDWPGANLLTISPGCWRIAKNTAPLPRKPSPDCHRE